MSPETIRQKTQSLDMGWSSLLVLWWEMYVGGTYLTKEPTGVACGGARRPRAVGGGGAGAGGGRGGGHPAPGGGGARRRHRGGRAPGGWHRRAHRPHRRRAGGDELRDVGLGVGGVPLRLGIEVLQRPGGDPGRLDEGVDLVLL